jgi:sugar phosphate isomerase/epimerase
MNHSRRKFIKQGAFTLAGTALLSKSLFAATKANTITGLQLYSVRDDMHKDPLGTLKQLQSFGYVYVEHANYVNRKFYGYEAKEFKKILDDLGLKMKSGHTVMTAKHYDYTKNDFTDAWKFTVDDAATVGQMYVISPWLDENLRKNEDDLKKFLDLFNKSGELCKKSGMQFGYHNHNFEFSSKLNDKTVFDIIMQNTDPNLVIQQLDIGNMYGVGGRAMDVLKKYPGRFVSMHVKDEIKSDKAGEMSDGYESTILGAGVVGTKEIVDYAKKYGGTTYYIIEQESYQDKTPLQASKEDFEVMKKWGY